MGAGDDPRFTMLETLREYGLNRLVESGEETATRGRHAAWYRDLLGLSYVREFSNDAGVTGCALADWQARYLIALRLRGSTSDDPPRIITEHRGVGFAPRAVVLVLCLSLSFDVMLLTSSGWIVLDIGAHASGRWRLHGRHGSMPVSRTSPAVLSTAARPRTRNRSPTRRG